MEGSGDFYKKYNKPNLSAGCTDINHINTNNSGDDILILAYGKHMSERDSSLRGPPNISSIIEDSNDYYKDPSYSTKMIEKNFNLIRIKGESRTRTRKVLIIRNVTKEHYKNNILQPKEMGSVMKLNFYFAIFIISLLPSLPI